MRVRLLVARATARGFQRIGDEIEVTAAEAERLFAAGHAAPVRRGRAERTARVDTTEKATR